MNAWLNIVTQPEGNEMNAVIAIASVFSAAALSSLMLATDLGVEMALAVMTIL